MEPHLRVAYVGNFGPAHSTENHVAAALRNLGHEVFPLQENDPLTWRLVGADLVADCDLMLWTRTWHLPEFDQLGWLGRVRDSTPTVAYHLDRWWGLDREHQVADEPMFSCDLVVTADGGHDDQWREAGVAHLWMPPAVLAAETLRVGRYREELAHDVVFVGSWQHYHAEWDHRMQLVAFLRRTYGRNRARTRSPRLGLYPRGRSVRGQDLADLYASSKVVVGDSCLAGGATHYWSDRVPETLGRRGALVHPWVEGMGPWFGGGGCFAPFELYDWADLEAQIERLLADDEVRVGMAERGQRQVRQLHTYEVRMASLLDELGRRGLVAA